MSTDPATSATPTRWLSRQELRSLYQIGTANMTLRRWEQQGRFPQRSRLLDGQVVWSEPEIQRWVQRSRP